MKASQIGDLLSSLEKSSSQASTPMQYNPANKLKLCEPPVKKPHLRIDPIPPFNANKIRKSPSTLAQENGGGGSGGQAMDATLEGSSIAAKTDQVDEAIEPPQLDNN